MKSFFDVKVFQEEGFTRKKCKKCGRYFWTVNEDLEICTDQPCGEYEFIGKRFKTGLELKDVREAFLGFFEKNGHSRIKRYPVVARWREDVYLVGASIYDFQPWVTEGIVPPPANPLTISQPCIRLTDVENVGKTGRHLTTFEMMAHHAFNFGKIHVYWNEETVRYSLDFFVKELGIPKEKIVYIEDLWSGGGNAGEDFEIIVDGLEVATLVFMHYRVINGDMIPMNNFIVDTGYGLERIYWFLTGAPTIYDAVFGKLVEKLRLETGVPPLDHRILEDISRYAGKFSSETPELEKKFKSMLAEKHGFSITELNEVLRPYEVIFRLLDHSRALMFMLGDGIVPSNSGEGYLARLLIRRSLKDIYIQKLPFDLRYIVDLQLEFWRKEFPEYLELRDLIDDIIDVETKRFHDLVRRGKDIVLRKLLKRGKKSINVADLVQLYDSQGIPPELVKDFLRDRGVEVEIPGDFYSRLAKLHESTRVSSEKAEEIPINVEGLPQTNLLYYSDPKLARCTAKVLKIAGEGKYIVLDQTIFYPEGGGAEADRGWILSKRFKAKVVDVKKVKNIVVHVCDQIKGTLLEGDEVECILDVERRNAISRAHTATHIILAAARKILGKHVWQAGAHKTEDYARLDITHYKRLTRREIEKIEELANKIVLENRKINVYNMDRNLAEKRYGFTLYQGGVVPENVLRIVEVENWDAEACGGIHCTRTGEVGLIKIFHTERIQDGVERLEYATGLRTLKHIQDLEKIMEDISRDLNVPLHDLRRKVNELLEEKRRLSSKVEKLEDKIIEIEVEKMVRKAVCVKEFHVITDIIEGDDLNKLRKTAFYIRDNYADALAFIILVKENKKFFMLTLGEKVMKRITANAVLNILKEHGFRLSGGGRKHFAQGIIDVRDPRVFLEEVKTVLLNCLK
ncbi:MAG: alanine--tRNA ligase [Thermoproteales archaeon]|nr:alanine--tRNA ligase [Thermoproteales archaeon]